MSFRPLYTLCDLIYHSISALESIYSSRSEHCRVLDDPIYHNDTNKGYQQLFDNPEVIKETRIIVASARQIIALISSPKELITEIAFSYQTPVCLGLIEKTHVVEILRDAEPCALHVTEIASQNGLNPDKLAHAMRLLASQHIFKEISPDTFMNNKLSSQLDTGKSTGFLRDSPSDKYSATNGIAAFVGMVTDEMLKAASYVSETYTNPNYCNSSLPTRTAFNVSFGTDLPYWDWIEAGTGDVNFSRMKRTAAAMKATQKWEDEDGILFAIDWSALSNGDVVSDPVIVDVGGGFGHTSRIIHRAFPQLRILIQDREPVIKAAVKHWKDEGLDLDKNPVSFEVHNFFERQPIQNASVFLLRAVLHDWSDEFALKILCQLRESAVMFPTKTRLLIGDHIVPYTCREESIDSNQLVRQKQICPGYPLLSFVGQTSSLLYAVDMGMQAVLNGKERTFEEFQELCHCAGWNISSVRRTSSGSGFAYLIAEPV